MPTSPHRLCSHLVNTSRASLAATSLPYTTASLAITSILLRHGLISNLTFGNPSQPSPSEFPTLPVPAKRIWVNHKYRDGYPVLRHLRLVSKPSVRVEVTREELGRILTGKRARNVSGIGLGEILVVKVDRDREVGRVGTQTYMEGWEAWRSGLGGEIVCRAGGWAIGSDGEGRLGIEVGGLGCGNTEVGGLMRGRRDVWMDVILHGYTAWN